MRVSRKETFSKELFDSAWACALSLTAGDGGMAAFAVNNPDVMSMLSAEQKYEGFWLLTSLSMYAALYDNAAYESSGESWRTFSQSIRDGFGLPKGVVTDRISAASFFVAYHKELISAGWSIGNSSRSLSRGWLAESICGDSSEVIKHIVGDTWTEFHDWYTSEKGKLPKKTRNAPSKISVEIPSEVPVEKIHILSECIGRVLEILVKGGCPKVSDLLKT